MIEGELYKRYDLKPGRTLPANAIPCQDYADPVTGHFPHWVKCSNNSNSDKWLYSAYNFSKEILGFLPDGTYEAVGKHFNANPYNLLFDRMERHGRKLLYVERSFEGVRKFLHRNAIEGIVFWYDGKPICKIKRTDFGFTWPVKWSELYD